VPEAHRYRKNKERHGLGKVSRHTKDIARMLIMQPGKTYQEVGDRFGVSRQRVGQVAVRMDIKRPKQGEGEE
jgi:DNA-directed RNA polymerase sigma subunit (sigma70/sigma32)|tara:strand:- start:188 stop:403 length:216 start_codon:yes stop_codon:yes gene_type:complete